MTGGIRYYARGGFDREVYDPYDFRNASNQAAHDCQYFSKTHQEELNRKDPLVSAEAEKLCRMQKMVEKLEGDTEARKVLIRIDKAGSTGQYDVLSLEFK